MKKIRNFLRRVRFVVIKVLFSSRIIGSNKNYFSCGHLAISEGFLKIGNDNVLSSGFEWEIIHGSLSISNRNYFNKNVKIVCMNSISIGNDCLFADSVHIYDHDHGFNDLKKPIKDQGFITKPIVIGNNVWIGVRATILKGVTVGSGAIIGANSVVTKDVPVNAVVAGNPAVVVKMRGHVREAQDIAYN